VEPACGYGTYQTPLAEGSLLVLYTDGLIEVERQIDKGYADLLNAVEREMASPRENFADAIQRRIFTAAEPRDDVAILTLRLERLRGSPDSRSSRDEVNMGSGWERVIVRA
jgi:serine phosphatase RsbU (regulator of sigma subunit)